MAVVNQKGGTGKTTTCENLGVGLAMEGKKVLLVDTDPQASLTICLGHPVPDQLSPTLSDMMGKILSEQPIAPGEGILHHPEGVDLIPANIELGFNDTVSPAFICHALCIIHAFTEEVRPVLLLESIKFRIRSVLHHFRCSVLIDNLARVFRVVLPVAEPALKLLRLCYII